MSGIPGGITYGPPWTNQQPGAMNVYSGQSQLAALQQSQQVYAQLTQAGYANQNCMGISGQQNAAPPSDGTWETARAAIWAEDGDKIIDRMAFWRGLGAFGAPVLNRLARQLDAITDQIEPYLQMAERARARASRGK